MDSELAGAPAATATVIIEHENFSRMRASICKTACYCGRTSLLDGPLKIRLFGPRPLGVRIGVVLLVAFVVSQVFGADEFLPFGVRGAPIRDQRLPGHRKDAFILDSEFELQ